MSFAVGMGSDDLSDDEPGGLIVLRVLVEKSL